MAEQNFYKQDTLPGPEAKEIEQEVFSVPKSIGPYKIESLLENGGMSTVYLGTHPETQNPVTIKTLLPKFLDNPEIVKRFLNEAQIIAKTDHQNIVNLYGHGEWEGGLYIALEFIEGQSLRQYLQQSPISLKKALEIILEISYALCHLHTHGIIHRDLKLENILVTEGGNIKVIDFGIAQLLNESMIGKELSQNRIIGTPIYMSPEQRKNPEAVSYPSDIYSLGIIAYELILGKLSHGKIHISLMPKGLQKTLSKALQPTPNERYQDVVDFITAVSAYMNSAMLEKEKKSSDELGEVIEKIHLSHISLLPSASPKWPQTEVAFTLHKGKKHAGITYDFLEFPDGSFGIAMGESTSQTAEGIIHTSFLNGLVKGLSISTETQSSLIDSINKIILEGALKQVFPFALLRIHPEEKKYTYTACSYSTLWALKEPPQQMICNNPTLGIEPQVPFQHIEGGWNPGDELLLTSLPPVKASDDQPSEEMIATYLKECLKEHPQEKVEALFHKIKSASKRWLELHSLLLISIKNLETI